MYRRLTVQIDGDAAAKVMGSRCHGNIIFGDIYAEAQALLINIGEVMACLFGVFVRYVKIYMVVAVEFHFAVYSACNNVTRRQRQSRVILLHEFIAT